MHLKHVLMIAYYFPPLGGAGVQRTIKFIKYLVRKKWKVTVLTVNEDKYFIRDSFLFGDIDDNVTVARAPCISTERIFDLLNKMGLGLLSNLMLKAMIPDKQIGWSVPAILKAKEILTTQDVDLIYTTSSPYTSHFIGYYLKTRFKKYPWIADFRDPWTQNVILYNYLGNTRKAIDEIFERKILNKCDHVITVTESCSNNLIDKFNLDPGKVSTITNGYDEEDFDSSPKVRKRHNRLKIVYSGSAYHAYNPGNVIDAVARVLDTGRHNIQMTFLGESSQWAEKYIKDKYKHSVQAQCFDYRGYVKHDESIETVMDADLLVLVIPNSIPYNMTGKIFEYLRSGNPILAAVPVRGDAAKVIKGTKTGFVVDPDDKAGIENRIQNAYDLWLDDRFKLTPEIKAIESFRRNRLTDKLITIFENALRKTK